MEEILSINNLSFAYPRQNNILNDISANIQNGDLITLLGPNGVGKSTLLNCITGLLAYKEGIIKLKGNNLLSLKIKNIAQTIAYVPQTLQKNFDYTVREYVAMGRTAYKNIIEPTTINDFSLADEALEKLDILKLKSRLFSEISGGEQQQVCIARALAQQPNLIVLDEPTSALDFDNQIKVLNLTKKLSDLGYAVLMTTHNPEHSLLLNSKVWILDRKGNMMIGPAEELITEKTLGNLYSSQISVSTVSSSDRKICFVNSL